MKVVFICDSGSPVGVTPDMIYGRGVGGAEYGLMSLAETLAERGHEVIVRNQKRTMMPKKYGNVLYTHNDDIDSDHDVAILFRAPSELVHKTKAALKLFWSCDPYTTGDYRKIWEEDVDAAVCISPYHAGYFQTKYGIRSRMTAIDLGVRLQDYNPIDISPIEDIRVPNKIIFCSVPDRGLHRLFSMWPRIKAAVPDATLEITSDYSLWTGGNPSNQGHRKQWQGLEGVIFHGAVPRAKLVQLQQQSSYHVYPCIYDEMFCIAAAETQCAGAVPLTSQAGALKSTNQWGFVLPGDPTTNEWLVDFTEFVIFSMKDDLADSSYTRNGHRIALRGEMMEQARARFNWHTIAESWEKIFSAGVQ